MLSGKWCAVSPLFLPMLTEWLPSVTTGSCNPDYKVHGANRGPPGSCRSQMGPMLASRTLLSGCTFLKMCQTSAHVPNPLPLAVIMNLSMLNLKEIAVALNMGRTCWEYTRTTGPRCCLRRILVTPSTKLGPSWSSAVSQFRMAMPMLSAASQMIKDCKAWEVFFENQGNQHPESHKGRCEEGKVHSLCYHNARVNSSGQGCSSSTKAQEKEQQQNSGKKIRKVQVDKKVYWEKEDRLKAQSSSLQSKEKDIEGL